MKKKFNTVVVLFLFFVATSSYGYPTAKVTVKVIDEKGTQIEGAEIGCNFETPKTTGLGVVVKRIKGESDTNGLFISKGSTSSGFVSCTATKKGYYNGGGGTGKFTAVSGVIGFRKWKPWNPIIDIVLKKIINPIPMYVAQINGQPEPSDLPATLPEVGKFFGFDLIAKDWVVPYGQGLHSDFLFKIDVDHYVDSNDYDSTMTLKFPNVDDGIQSFYSSKKSSSDFLSSHTAPLGGYEDAIVMRINNEKNKVLILPFKDDQNYYFRVRTKRDERGNIIQAYYGKIYGNIKFYIPNNNNKGKIYFSYYLNPNNNDTNVEFSPEKNLFPKPKAHTGVYRFRP